MATVIAKHLNLEVVEGSNGYYIYYTPTGECRGMGDGVDMLTREDDSCISPGTQEFNDQIAADLDIEYNHYLEAYFGDVIPDASEAPERWIDSHSVNCIYCGRLFDERMSIGHGDEGAGDICPDHPEGPFDDEFMEVEADPELQDFLMNREVKDNPLETIFTKDMDEEVEDE